MQRLALTKTLVVAFALAYVLVRFPYFADLSAHTSGQLDSVGIVSLFGVVLPAAATWTIASVTVVSGIAFLRGRFARFSGVAFFLSLLWITTYRSSFGKILHSENLLVLHVGVLAVSAFLRDPERWALRTMSIATVLTYVVAGVSKLRAGGVAWLTGRALGEWLAFDAVRKIELGSFHSPVAVWVASSPLLCGLLAVFTLLVELGAPVALASPRLARAWSIAAWCFHAGILMTMAIGFFYPLSGVAFASLLDIERHPRIARLARLLAGGSGAIRGDEPIVREAASDRESRTD
jgi:hypothetical protein